MNSRNWQPFFPIDRRVFGKEEKKKLFAFIISSTFFCYLSNLLVGGLMIYHISLLLSEIIFKARPIIGPISISFIFTCC